MGVVYRAQDTKLERPVALKFLPAHLLGNEEVRKRFEREAKASAALAHPNVCRVYEIDEADGKTFLAMELVEGESLDQKIARGPLKLEDALSIAQQVAKGLEAAHKRGVVHRDVKPENIMVGEDGHVTIMDFGLAQLTEASRLTKMDETLGTVAYMSPEQTEGAGTDHRTDIWSLGVVVYEMITGQQPFKGDYDKAVMYSILNEQPEPVTALRTGVGMEPERIVGKCLAKAPSDRYQSAADLIVDLRACIEDSRSGRSHVAAGDAFRGEDRSRRDAQLWAACGVATIFLVLALLGWMARSEPRELPYRTFSIPVEPLPVRSAISPDGRRIAYLGNDQSVWILDLSRRDLQAPWPLEETVGADRLFWSPDSQWLGFTSERGLMKTRIEGGSPVIVSDYDEGAALSGAVWLPDGRIVFSSLNGGFLQVPASGGDLEFVNGSAGLAKPQPFPGDTELILAVVEETTLSEDEVVAFDLGLGRPVRGGRGNPGRRLANRPCAP